MSSITYCTFQQEKKPILHTQPYACHHGLIQNDDLDNLVPLFITYVSREISSSMNSNEKKICLDIDVFSCGSWRSSSVWMKTDRLLSLIE